MPELPEVETIRRGLQERLADHRIRGAWRSAARLRADALEPAHLEGRRFASFGRHGKHLLLGLDSGQTLVLHLGMTGKLLLEPADAPMRPHTHLVLACEGPQEPVELRFTDPRRFGMLALRPPGPVPDTAHYGPDALDPALDGTAWDDALERSKAPLKSFLLDQTKLAGVGNIYACEALWRAGLSPRRRACNWPASRRPLLLSSVRDVLHDSLAQGGTSFNDYVDALGRPGTFLLQTAVFRREGLPCPRCGAPVRRTVQAGRSTFHCGRCQR